MDPKRPFRPTGRNSLLLLLLLLLVVAVAIIWGQLQTQTGQPKPAATANPPVAPESSSPED
ncbi:hypothetical protein [Sphingosinicella rhizophila]|uniref:Uncharacterized protein n=1 Tax=Sphingosinicella rhizophila TaxID=3050082 RepID=A0ABU3Q7L1_9SPHN|nr:hypothetical protein [Sphingosinicella sp. GR2756]MDT9598963.1 hypothetical protein [Sphingosinicella sp. GR2756]